MNNEEENGGPTPLANRDESPLDQEADLANNDFKLASGQNFADQEKETERAPEENFGGSELMQEEPNSS